MQQPTLSTEPRDTFLSHFDGQRRGTVSNWLLEPIRQQHEQNPRAVVAFVLAMLTRRLNSQWVTDQTIADTQRAIDLFRSHYDDAVGCAAYYITYEQLPEHEKEALKSTQREAGKAVWMATKPPSPKQLDYLRSLGYVGAPPATMAEASDAIDRQLTLRGKAVTR